MPQYKLYYFNSRGRAETVRLIFAQAGIPYEDYRITDRKEWDNELKPKMPMGQVPVLEVDGKLLAESSAIYRYLANQFECSKHHYVGLSANGEWEAALCDMLGDSANDAHVHVHEKNEEKRKQIVENLKNEKIIPFTNKCEEMLAASNSGFYVGSQLTWTDLLLFCEEETWSARFPDVMEARPKMVKHMEKIANLPRIKEWLQQRPQTEY